ncbi:hypothetical protein D9619_003377 [Psilocybe cf. subviscida]|uniref:Uncharacterized protein n=1 Tax=Psilocybe cf. subviscida TaxID=2480587 RepID=A0A8H5AXA9_9AGAR|nr:hypothetical protein D9619_003377 [Psilocybe cf. subviscida]
MDDLKRMISASQVVLDQTPPPSLREILTAYRTKGDGDRDMLLSMLNAKTAEDQRLSAGINLQRTILEIFQTTQLSPAALAEAAAASHHQQPNHSSHSSYARSAPAPHATNGYHYPSPGFAPSPREREMRDVRDSGRDRRSSAGVPHRHYHHRASSRSRSPPPRGSIHSSSSSSVPNGYMHADGPRKRRRPSPSPHPHAQYDSSHMASSEQFPPSPYSSSSRSVDSAEYSPRSRASMTIGSLVNGDGPSQERERD